ncbi:hypothetical protein [Rhizobium leguminosarum]|jgi:hypothetical protein|uniref:hypothetical protein n=1 Tax=Rhizobium leguminosarum TaxID=384 RepID=UPI002E0F9982|nr:hypothetical protein U8Q02_39915 [Rhizobium leguminosarum]
MRTGEEQTAVEPKSGAERVAKHRRRKKQTELQIIHGLAKLVLGRDLGDQRLAMLSLLEKAARDTTIPPDVLDVLDLAVDKLKARPRVRF